MEGRIRVILIVYSNSRFEFGKKERNHWALAGNPLSQAVGLPSVSSESQQSSPHVLQVGKWISILSTADFHRSEDHWGLHSGGTQATKLRSGNDLDDQGKQCYRFGGEKKLLQLMMCGLLRGRDERHQTGCWPPWYLCPSFTSALLHFVWNYLAQLPAAAWCQFYPSLQKCSQKLLVWKSNNVP